MQPNVNVPNQVPNQVPMQQHQPQPMQPMQHIPTAAPTPKTSKLPWIILGVVVVIVLVVLGYVFRGKLGFQKATNLSGYTAVFLTNGQVYFGKLSHANDQYVQLTDIFYLQVNQPATGASGTGASATGTATTQQSAAQAQANAQLSLVKLGNELHGPADQMWISRSQILFYENLKSDGKVAQAIAQYNANPNAANTPAAQGTPSQTGNPQQAAPTSGTNGNINTGATGTGTVPAGK